MRTAEQRNVRLRRALRAYGKLLRDAYSGERSCCCHAGAPRCTQSLWGSRAKIHRLLRCTTCRVRDADGAEHVSEIMEKAAFARKLKRALGLDTADAAEQYKALRHDIPTPCCAVTGN